MLYYIIGVVAAAVFAVLIGYFYSSDQIPASCNMKIPGNRDFNKYYGIVNAQNHFETVKADDCNSRIVFRPALPQAILRVDHSATSFMALAKYGSGKTLLRCEYVKSLSPNDYLKVLISDQAITEYVGRFVSNIDAHQSYCQTKNCLKNWSGNEFAQMLLSTLATQFVNTYDERNFKDRDLVLDQKISLIIIACYYYNDKGTAKLEAFVNSLLGKGMFGKYEIKEAEEQLQQERVKNDRQLLKHLQDDLAKLVILNQNFDRFLLLMVVLRGEGFESRARDKHLYGNSIRDLVEFSPFVKKSFKKMPVFVVDGIDDNPLFFQNGEVNSAALESFFRASISQKIIATVLAGHFHLSLFYPKIDNVNVENVIIQKDKFPTHVITWKKKALMNYADHVLEQMNKNASPMRCKPFPDFKTLVNYSNKEIAEIIDKLHTPRQLHHFMLELIQEMNDDADDVVLPFEAIVDNVRDAYNRASASFRN